MDGPDYIELIILLLPLITFVVMDIWDYLLTLYAVTNLHAYEINPLARHYLSAHNYEALADAKAMHILLGAVVYLIGISLYELGKVRGNHAVQYLGAWLLIIFFVAYLVGLIIISLNISTVTTTRSG